MGRDTAESPGKHHVGGLAVKVCRCCHLASAPTTCRWPATTRTTPVAWVVTVRCAGGASVIVNSDAYLCLDSRGPVTSVAPMLLSVDLYTMVMGV